jgi:glycosyltransferase involved in cell wall biosynthesis
LRQFGHRVLVVAPRRGLTEFEGARIHGVPAFPFPLYPELKVAVPRPSIGTVLARFRPDLIHAAHPVCLGASAFHYSAEHKVPLVVSYHCQLPKWLHYYRLGFLEPLAWWGVKAAYNRADLTLATSEWMQAELREHGVRRVELWRRGVDTGFFDPQRATREMRERLTQGQSQAHLLLYVGRLSAEKGIEQCRAVLTALPGTRLALVGDGPHRRKLEQYFKGTPTYFAGYLTGADLSAAFASADVFLMPSRTETLGLVLLEAMASGCPIVAAGAGGILDVIQDGITGHLYNPKDESGAIAATRRLLSDSNHHGNMCRLARLEAERWSWAAATGQLMGFYRMVTAREPELRRQVTRQAAIGASEEEICEKLQISRATFRRHSGRQREAVRAVE